jgi:hypothetical protein
MKKEDFAGLLESVQQAGEILRGTRQPSRHFVRHIDEAETGRNRSGLAVCVETDDPELLIPFKVYEVEFIDDVVCLTDEAGESAVYPREFLLALSFDVSTENLLRERMKAA